MINHKKDVKKKPLISVLIFSYNHEKYISEAILSALDQKTSFDFEIIVTDDCSSDNSLKVINFLNKKHPDKFDTIINDKNLGVNNSFLNAVKKANGEYIATLGGDDYWIDEKKLELQAEILKNNPKISYVHTEYKSINEKTGKIKRHCNKKWLSSLICKSGKQALTDMLSHNWTSYPLASSALFRKKPILEGIKNNIEIINFNMHGEGTFVHTSCCFYGGQYAFIPKETTMYRIRDKSLSHFESNIDHFEFQKKYYNLRILSAESFGLKKEQINKIKKNGIIELFTLSLKQNTTKEFYKFLKMKFNNKNFQMLYIISKNKHMKTLLLAVLKIRKWVKTYLFNRLYLLIKCNYKRYNRGEKT